MNIIEKDSRKDALKKRIREKIDELRNYQPKVGVFGVTGVGKSSLCNALFGSDAAKVSDVAACTREPQKLFIGGQSGQGGICLIDVPGVGETEARDKEYFELYKSLMPELDLVIWVIKADDRAYTVAQDAYKEILLPHADKCPTLFIINQVDKLNPIKEWDSEKNQPSEKQQQNINAKILEVSNAFGISARQIEVCSVEEKYHLIDVMDKIVEILPKEKKYAFVREAKEEVVTEESATKAEKGIWDSIKEFAGDAWDTVKDFATTTLIETAGTAIKAVASTAMGSIGSFFKKFL